MDINDYILNKDYVDESHGTIQLIHKDNPEIKITLTKNKYNLLNNISE